MCWVMEDSLVRSAPGSDFLVYDVERASFDFLINAADVFADNSEEQQPNPREKGDYEHQGGKTFGVLVKDKLREDGIDGEEYREDDSAETTQGGSSNGNR